MGRGFFAEREKSRGVFWGVLGCRHIQPARVPAGRLSQKAKADNPKRPKVGSAALARAPHGVSTTSPSTPEKAAAPEAAQNPAQISEAPRQAPREGRRRLKPCEPGSASAALAVPPSPSLAPRRDGPAPLHKKLPQGIPKRWKRHSHERQPSSEAERATCGCQILSITREKAKKK